jgi:hypothetical protein
MGRLIPHIPISLVPSMNVQELAYSPTFVGMAIFCLVAVLLYLVYALLRCRRRGTTAYNAPGATAVPLLGDGEAQVDVGTSTDAHANSQEWSADIFYDAHGGEDGDDPAASFSVRSL